MKNQFQRSISDLERSIKHRVLKHQNHNTHVWMEVNHLLRDPEALYAYCDCSVVNGCFHLGVCIVGLDTCRLYAKSVSTQFPQYTVLGELHAIQFTIGCVRGYLATYGDTEDVRSVYVFSDVEHIERILLTNSRRTHESIRKSVRRLRRSVNRFNEQFPEITLSVLYIGNTNERNLYYRSAH